jgi:threo-3-hydroxy-L-aspartate ammonia-lyase
VRALTYRRGVIGLEDVLAASKRLEGVAHRTPVLRSRTLDERTGATIFLKAENLQRGGAFKFRGAYNRICTLPPEQLQAGVVAYSSGNHAQAVALAARLVGTHATILMPTDAPSTKMEATAGYGAEIVRYDRYRDDRAELAAGLAAGRGLTVVPPFDDPLVMAGQGTAALELLNEVEDLDLLMAPIGGGGLIAGSATAANALRPRIRVVGVEPEASDDTKRSLDAGRRVRLPAVPATIADGLQLAVPGELPFRVIRELVDDVVLVSDEEIVLAMRFLFERLKVVVEPSGAVPVAALLRGKVEVSGRRVGAILSGGNVGARRFAELLEVAEFAPHLPERPD